MEDICRFVIDSMCAFRRNSLVVAHAILSIGASGDDDFEVLNEGEKGTLARKRNVQR